MGDLSLSEIATITSGKRPPCVEKEPTSLLNVPVIGGGGPSGFTSDHLYDGGILITGRVGTLGKLFAPDFPCWPSDNALVVFPKDQRTDFRFLRYALQLRIAEAAGMNRGAANPLITQKDLGTLRLYHPPLPEQRAIAATLGALDDKIELNRKMNATLEAMARALFRDWFVDFGPTRAKMEARAPYLSPDLWSLFPDRLDAEGKPEGWEVGTLSQLCEVTIGGLWGNDSPSGGDVPFSCLRGVDLQQLREDGFAPKVPQRFAKASAVDKRAIRTTDVLVASSGAGPCGRSLWVGIEGFFDSSLVTYSNFVKRLACVSEAAACFVDRVLFEMRESGEISQFITGTSVPNLNDHGLLKSHRLVLPNPLLMQRYRDFVAMVQAHLFSGQNETLAQTRDLLLPRLMSGELRVAEAERLIGEVA